MGGRWTPFYTQPLSPRGRVQSVLNEYPIQALRDEKSDSYGARLEYFENIQAQLTQTTELLKKAQSDLKEAQNKLKEAQEKNEFLEERLSKLQAANTKLGLDLERAREQNNTPDAKQVRALDQKVKTQEQEIASYKSQLAAALERESQLKAQLAEKERPEQKRKSYS